MRHRWRDVLLRLPARMPLLFGSTRSPPGVVVSQGTDQHWVKLQVSDPRDMAAL